MAMPQLTHAQTDHHNNWVVVTFKQPVCWKRSSSEVWMFNPGVRYILNANQLMNLESVIESISDLKSGSKYKPLVNNGPATNLRHAKLLVERYRERGIGDILFMTGVLAFLKSVAGESLNIDYYGLTDRSQILQDSPLLRFKSVLVGPVIYDSIDYYDAHWFVDTATEYDSERDQLNVYDALYNQLGFNYSAVPLQFKRPCGISVSSDDFANLDTLYYAVYQERKLDLRRIPYYIVAPISNGSLRVMPYQTWLHTIELLAERRPVIVIGSIDGQQPAPDMNVGDFNAAINALRRRNVINLLGATELRTTMALIKNAAATVCLDSGPLYISQALGTPAVSIWGPHDPRVRIGYDKALMDTAVWNSELCRRAPCFAFSRFPETKCPDGANQCVCQVLAGTATKHIIDKLNTLEGAKITSVPVLHVPKE